MTNSLYGGYPPVPSSRWDEWEAERFLADTNSMIDRAGDPLWDFETDRAIAELGRPLPAFTPPPPLPEPEPMGPPGPPPGHAGFPTTAPDQGFIGPPARPVPQKLDESGFPLGASQTTAALGGRRMPPPTSQPDDFLDYANARIEGLGVAPPPGDGALGGLGPPPPGAIGAGAPGAGPQSPDYGNRYAQEQGRGDVEPDTLAQQFSQPFQHLTPPSAPLTLPVNETGALTGDPNVGPVEVFQRGAGRGLERTVNDVIGAARTVGENLPALGQAVGRGNWADAAGALGQVGLGALGVAGSPFELPGNVLAEGLTEAGVPDPVSEAAGFGLNFAAQGGVPLVRAAGRGLRQLPERVGQLATQAGNALEDFGRVMPEGQLAATSGRFYHGTGSSFETPDAARFDPNGLYGPGYYLTDEPRVAASYADVRGPQHAQAIEDADRRLAHYRERLADPALPPDQRASIAQTMRNDEALRERFLQLSAAEGGPQIRPVDVPEGLRLLDAEAPAPDLVTDLADHLDMTGQTDALEELEGWLARPDWAIREGLPGGITNRPPTGDEVLQALAQSGFGEKAEINALLSELGYDGIRYPGGVRVPLNDDAGRPIEHTAVAVFPESLPKLRNALSGQPGGITPPGIQDLATDIGSLLRGAAGNPSRAETAAGQVGMLAGTGAGATQIEEGDDPGTIAGKLLTGAVAGGLAGPAAVRLGRGARTAAAGILPEAVDEAARLRQSLEARYQAWETAQQRVQQVDAEIAARGARGTGAIERPNWAAASGSSRALTANDLEEIARRSGVNPYAPQWHEQIDPEAVRLYRSEVVQGRTPETAALAGGTPGQQRAGLAALRRERQAMNQQLRQFDRELNQDLARVSILEERAGRDPFPWEGVARADARDIGVPSADEWDDLARQARLEADVPGPAARPSVAAVEPAAVPPTPPPAPAASLGPSALPLAPPQTRQQRVQTAVRRLESLGAPAQQRPPGTGPGLPGLGALDVQPPRDEARAAAAAERFAELRGVQRADARGNLLSRRRVAEQAARQLTLPDFAATADQLTQPERGALARIDGVLGTYGRLNLLTSPLTSLRNIAGTAPALGWRFAEALVAPVVEPVWRAVGKTGEARYAGEAGRLAGGYWHALHAAGANFVDVLRHGDPEATAAQTGRVATGRVEQALDVGFRPLSATDAFFKTIAEGGELYTGAYRMARGRGLTGDALDAEVLRLVQDPPQELVDRAAQAGKYLTYTQAMDQVGEGLAKVARVPGMQVLMPFVRTPYNAAKFDLERSPLGALSVGRAALDPKSTSGELADKTARALIGGSVAAALFKYALDGGVTGAIPDSPSERDAWEAEGKKPWSIRLGDNWYDFRLIPGLNANLAVAATLADQVRGREADPDASWMSQAGRFGLELANVLVQRPLLDGLAGLMEAIGDPRRADQFFERMAGTVAGMAIPGSAALAFVENATDPAQRAPEGIAERVQARIPGLAGNAPVRRTAFGEEMTKPQTGWEAALNPIRRSPAAAGIRRYVGSESAAQDAEIAAAVSAYDDWYSKPREHKKPSDRQLELAKRYKGRVNPQYTRLRSVEAARGRREQTERAAAPNPLDQLGALLEQLPAYRYVAGGT